MNNGLTDRSKAKPQKISRCRALLKASHSDGLTCFIEAHNPLSAFVSERNAASAIRAAGLSLSTGGITPNGPQGRG